MTNVLYAVYGNGGPKLLSESAPVSAAVDTTTLLPSSWTWEFKIEHIIFTGNHRIHWFEKLPDSFHSYQQIPDV
jgi:hypothetical protein